MVPEGWEEHMLQELCEDKIVYGIVQAGDHVEDGIPYIKSSDVGGQIPVHSLAKTDPTIHKRYKRSTVRPGDIVFSLRGNTGETSIVPEHLKEANLTQGTAKVAVNGRADNRFLKYQLSSHAVRARVHAVSKGSTFTEISLADLRKIPVVLPPLPEQEKIAEILSTWDKAIETTEKLLANAEAQKKALMQQLLTGKRRLKGFEGEWRSLPFDSCFRVANDKRTQVPKNQYKAAGSVPIVDQGQEFICGYTDNQSFYDDVPVVVFGDHTRVVKWVDFPFCPGADGTQILKTKPGIDPRFGLYLMQYCDVPNLGYSRHMRELKKAVFRVSPNLDEQRALGTLFADLDVGIQLEKRQLEALQAEKQALMQQLLTGKRRVNVR